MKWLIILLTSFGIIMALYEFLVRRFNVLRVLFGMKPIARQPVAQAGKAVVMRRVQLQGTNYGPSADREPSPGMLGVVAEGASFSSAGPTFGGGAEAFLHPASV